MVTAETAAAVPALVLLLVVALGLVLTSVDTVRCTDAARAGARAAARGEPGVDIARRVAPAGAVVAVSRSGSVVTVEVTAQTRAVVGWLPATTRPRARAVAELEDAAGADDVTGAAPAAGP